MQKIIFGIFAHPDDEAFGPSGTLIKEARAGNEVHLITLTAGEAGVNPDAAPDLASVRLKEWRTAGHIIGASSMHYLGFPDGRLNNTIMVAAQQKIIALMQAVLATRRPPATTIELMTIDLNGVTGHIDHIVAARAASFVFYHLKQQGYPLQRIRYACLPQQRLQQLDTSWIFMEAGHNTAAIDETVDVAAYEDDIRAVIAAHHTQRADAARHLATPAAILSNHFIVRS